MTDADLGGVPGVVLSSVAAGIRYKDRDDLLIIALPEGSATAAVFTRNAFCAAPVTLARRHLQSSGARSRYLLINAGNANAGTGARGLADAEASCQALAEVAGCKPEQVLPFSTGVIGEYLPVERIAAHLPEALQGLTQDAWSRAAHAIMTTDTRPKLAERQVQLGDQTATLVGIAKGAGMIRPNMATMLAFLATDADIAPELLQAWLSRAADRTFNCISIDGDTSTNDACVLSAAGTLGNAPLAGDADPGAAEFYAALESLCDELATAIVRDGEGATKLVRVEVLEAATEAEAVRVAETIAHSPLVKTALFASDPNWGRILATVGRAGLDDLRINGVRIWLDDSLIVSNGGRDPGYQEADGKAVMSQDAFRIRVAMGRGSAETHLLTCDLSYDYVRINADYRT